MKNGLYNTCLLKWLFLCAFGVAVASCITVQRHVYAEGQTKYSKDFFDSAEPIRIKDPLAVALGAMDKGGVFVFTYADAVKFAGHSCPAVAGAYKSTQIALKALYGEEVSVRGNIKVTFKGSVDYVSVSERIDKLMPLVISGKASEEESKEFGNLWQERVKTILLSPPEGAFIVKELKD